MHRIDDTLSLGDTSVPRRLHTSFDLARTYGSIENQTPLILPIFDFARARKHIGIDQSYELFSYIALFSEEGEPFTLNVTNSRSEAGGLQVIGAD